MSTVKTAVAIYYLYNVKIVPKSFKTVVLQLVLILFNCPKISKNCLEKALIKEKISLINQSDEVNLL